MHVFASCCIMSTRCTDAIGRAQITGGNRSENIPSPTTELARTFLLMSCVCGLCSEVTGSEHKRSKHKTVRCKMNSSLVSSTKGCTAAATQNMYARLTALQLHNLRSDHNVKPASYSKQRH